MNRSIVIISGRPPVGPLQRYLQDLDEGIVILCSEEDATFDYKSVIPAHVEVWTQYFSESKRDIKHRLILGPPSRIKDYKINKHLPKEYLWSFVGQVQNPHRQKCVEVLSKLKGGYLRTVSAFGGNAPDGIEYQEYLDIMCKSMFVICPSGSMSADSFRLYEAMECGAIPITDCRCPRDAEKFNYWGELGLIKEVYWLKNWKILEASFMKISAVTTENLWYSLEKSSIERLLLNYATYQD